MEFNSLKAAVEALLYVSDLPLSLKKMRETLGEEMPFEDVRAAVNSLVAEFDGDGRGVRIAELAGGYQFITRPEYAVYIKKLQKIRPPKLSAQSLETLAIIAYRQPIIKAEIEAIRGVSADGVIKTLLDRRLVKIAGRQDVPGKPMMYATTNEFLQYFGLKDLNSLPSLRELERELGMEENSILSGLEPELPGLDGPEMEEMAREYRAKKAAEAAEAAALEAAAISEAEVSESSFEAAVEAFDEADAVIDDAFEEAACDPAPDAQESPADEPADEPGDEAGWDAEAPVPDIPGPDAPEGERN
jgi:segregation and condensation protein B